MNAEELLRHYERVADTQDAIPRIRRFILELAVRGKLVPQDRKDEPAIKLLHRIGAERSRQLVEGEIRPSKAQELDPLHKPFMLPETWAWAALGSVFLYDAGAKCEPRLLDSGYWLLELEDLEKDTGRLLTRLRVSDRQSQSTKSEFRPGDVLYGKLRPYLNKVFVADEPGYSTTEIVALRAYLPLCSEYCALALRRPDFVDYVTRLGQGTKMPRLRSEDAVVAPFPLPPLAEQHRIVAKVDELMALCDRLEAARAEREAARDRLAAASLARLNAPDPETFADDARFALDALPALTARPDQIKQLRQTILDLAVRGRLSRRHDADGSGADLLAIIGAKRANLVQLRRKPDPRGVGSPPKGDGQATEPEEGNFALPGHWTWAAALELCERVDSGSTPPAAEMFDGAGDIPFIKVYNLTKNGSLDFSVKPTFVSRATHCGKLARSRILPGDVLMNIVGPPLGKVSIVPDSFPEWNTNQAVVLFRPLPEVLSQYFAICLLSTSVLSWLTDLAQQTVGQVNISVTKSRRLPIPLPPLAEQRRIVSVVSDLMSVCDRLEASLGGCDAVRTRALEALLRRTLEPAEALEEAA